MMEVRYAVSNKDVRTYDTKRLREEYHIDGLFKKDEIKLLYSPYDWIIAGSVCTAEKE